MSFTWLQPHRGGTTGTARNRTHEGIRITVTSTRRADGKQPAPQIVAVVEEDFMRQMRWQAGDRMLIGINDEAIALKRVTEHGYALSPINVDKAAREASFGKSVRSTIKASMPADWPLRPGDVLESPRPTIEADGVVLVPFSDEIVARGR